MTVTDIKSEMLKKTFGYSEFRPGQEELIDAILSGRDALGIMPTGAGKSVCFQLPALCMSGITVVISPLISLMKDQVSSLVQAGVRAAYLNSSLTRGQFVRAMNNACGGMYKIIYAAPERLETEEFMRFAKNADISMVTVDEAHCVSQWGHDFRPSYLKIGEFLNSLAKRPVLSAFTATATGEVRNDIVRLLGLRSPKTVITTFNRENLYFSVRTPKNKDAELLEFIRAHSGGSGIVYCATRRLVEEVCAMLCKNGIKAARYHAGMDDGERFESQDAFVYDKADVMVATNAFGMGIDKSNVAWVVHYNMPKNMESYYQEAGRAGRDGSEAECLMLYSGQDVQLNKFLIDKSENPELTDEMRDKLKKRDIERLYKMQDYCLGVNCLRRQILAYFGEYIGESCGKCSNCCENTKRRDVTDTARKVILALRETGGRFGAVLTAEILRGARTERITKRGLDTLECFGAAADMTDSDIRAVITALKNSGYILTAGGEYPTIYAAPLSEELFRDKARVYIKEAEPKRERSIPKTILPEDVDGELFSKLRAHRARLAAMQGVPAFVIFSDATLRAMAAAKPTSDSQLLEIPGVGAAKLKRYGGGFLEVIKEHQ